MRADGLVDQADGLWQPTLASVSESRSSSSPSESLPLGLMSGENRPCEFWGVTCGVSERDAVRAVKSSELSVRSILPRRTTAVSNLDDMAGQQWQVTQQVAGWCGEYQSRAEATAESDGHDWPGRTREHQYLEPGVVADWAE